LTPYFIYLDELLPTYLRVAGGISWSNEGAIASGWINTMKESSKNQFVEDMSKFKFELCNNEVAELNENDYTFDPICPKMINLHDKARERLAVSDLVGDHRFVLLVNIICATSIFKLLIVVRKTRRLRLSSILKIGKI